MEAQRKSLLQLFIPICLEILCFMLTGMVDTIMLSTQSDAAVGAVGTANTYIGMFIIMFNVITSGMIAVMTQYIGAEKPGIAYQARQLGIAFNMVLGVILSLVLVFLSDSILNIVGIAPALFTHASVYLKIVGGACILNALIPIFSSYLRAFGHTKFPLFATLSANVLNVILNAVFLFVLNWGVAGVAIATVISRIMNLLIVIICSRIMVKAHKAPERMSNWQVLKQILGIGVPGALENFLYNVAMTITISFLNKMDAQGINVTARSYACQIANFSFCAGAALAQANAIITGWRMGSRDYEACDRGTRKAAAIGIGVGVTFSLLFAIFAEPLMHMFTEDPEMIALVRKLLFIDIVLEIGRVTNLVYCQALKTSGDAFFPSAMAAIFMFLFMVGGTYFFGIHLGLMAVGAYIGMAMDECARAICMAIRWRTGIWKSKGLV